MEETACAQPGCREGGGATVDFACGGIEEEDDGGWSRPDEGVVDESPDFEWEGEEGEMVVVQTSSGDLRRGLIEMGLERMI